MSRLKRKKEDIDDIKEGIEQEQGVLNEINPVVVTETGGSISALSKNKQPEFNTWLTTLQGNNRFIGKDYMQSAEEYNTDSKMVGDAQIGSLSDSDMETLKSGTGDFNPETTKDSYNPIDNNQTNDEDQKTEQESVNKYADDAENGFIDITIIENLTKEFNDQLDEDIEKKAEEQLKVYHNDNTYKSPVDIPTVIENYKNLLIANHNPEIKKLNKN